MASSSTSSEQRGSSSSSSPPLASLPPTLSSAESVEQRTREVQRRREATDAFLVAEGGAKCARRPEPESEDGLGRDPEVAAQRFALVTMGTAWSAPRPVDPRNPFLRVYGAFATPEEAAEHADDVSRVDPDCSLAIVRCRSWFLYAVDGTADAATLDARRDELLAAHREECLREQVDFDARVARREASAASDAAAEGVLPEPVDRETLDAERDVYGTVRRMRAGAEVRGQAYAVLALQPHPEGECLVNVLGCFATADEARKWMHDVASKHIVDHDVVVAPLCEWLLPNSVLRTSSTCALDVRYRNEELQRMNDYMKDQEKTVMSFKDYAETSG